MNMCNYRVLLNFIALYYHSYITQFPSSKFTIIMYKFLTNINGKRMYNIAIKMKDAVIWVVKIDDTGRPV